MNFINFLGLSDSDYVHVGKGIIYVIYKLLWKIVYAMGELIDAITGLFYKLAGLDYLGSGGETLVEEKDLLSQIFNQNIVSNVSLFMIFTSIILMAVFGGIAVIKKLYFTKGEAKSTVDVIKNMVFAAIFLLCLTPLALFAISSISTITASIAGIFGNDMNVSIADIIFNSSFNGDYIGAYNEIYSGAVADGSEWVNITNWTEIKNSNFLFDLNNSGAQYSFDFYWYIFLLGGGIVLVNVVIMAFKVIKRIFNVVVLYIAGPIYVAKMVEDGGTKFREWKNKALSELISIVGTVIAFMLLLSLLGMINDLELIEVSKVAGSEGGSLATPLGGETTSDNSAFLINSLSKMLLLMAGSAVAKDSGDLLGNIFKVTNEEGNALLEGIYDKLSSREAKSTPTTQVAPRTRVITKTTTTNKRVINYTEDISSSNRDKSNINVVNNSRNNFNTTINNVDRKINNLQNRTNVSVSGEGTPRNDGVRSGNYKKFNNQGISKMDATNILNETFKNYRSESDKLRSEWDFMKNGNSSESKQVVKDFESASKELDSSISMGEQTKIKDSMSKYVNAYKKEEKVVRDGYKDFAGKSAKLSNDLTMKQQEELKKISSAYKKAQVDYGKTARKLNEVSQGNMSASEALRVKENADKQRAKLMEASSKANDFYNNQKKGV